MPTRQITMKTTAAGPDGVRRAGGTYDVPAVEAAELIDGGYASPCGECTVLPAITGDAPPSSETAPTPKRRKKN